jgi:glyoxylase-like metal-dependent hydrolase (beta-lactamase superfamily II)
MGPMSTSFARASRRVLVDAAWAWGGCARIISRAAERLFGPKSRPTAILLTHLHPDHDGAALELARAWDCPVYVHPDELPLARAVATADFAAIERYGNWLDRVLIMPLMRALPRHQPDGVAAVPSLMHVLRACDPASGVPGLPDWTCVPTPGHAPGHVAFFRARDRVLLTGDAALTVGGCLAWARGKSPPHAFDPPRYTNWQQDRTDASLAVLAELQPRVLAPGHGAPLVGEAATRELRLLAEHADARRRTAAVAVQGGIKMQTTFELRPDQHTPAGLAELDLPITPPSLGTPHVTHSLTLAYGEPLMPTSVCRLE